MTRKIHCKTCGKYLGEIRNATLSKYLVTVCDSCHKANSRQRAKDFMDNHDRGTYNTSAPDFMSDLFKGFNV